jgi:hypothetical protein
MGEGQLCGKDARTKAIAADDLYLGPASGGIGFNDIQQWRAGEGEGATGSMPGTDDGAIF